MNTFSLLEEILQNNNIEYIIEKLYIHKWNIKRWLLLKKVPDDYYNDLNELLNNKYPIKDSFKDKDQYFTKPEVAKTLYEMTVKKLEGLDIDLKEYTFIEPSAWNWTFYDLFPYDRRIWIDIEKQAGKDDFIIQNFLLYKPETKKNIIIWNPPFWLRWNLALRFINHAYDFADVVAFILPPLFNSNWKGNPKDRIKWYKLLHSEELDKNSFIYPNWKDVTVNTIFQIWVKIKKDKIKEEDNKSCSDYIKIYSLSDWWTPSSTRNKKMLDKCDIYLPSTCFKNMKVHNSFEELPNRRWYWIKILKDYDKINNILKNEIDWEKESFLSTNHAFNLRTSIIENALINKWYFNK